MKLSGVGTTTTDEYKQLMDSKVDRSGNGKAYTKMCGTCLSARNGRRFRYIPLSSERNMG